MPRGIVSVLGAATLFGALVWSSSALSQPQIEGAGAKQQEASVPQIEIDRAEQRVFGSNLNFWNRIKVITSQFHPSRQKAIRARIMHLYLLNNWDDLDRLRALIYLLSRNRNEPPVFLIRTEGPDTKGDFVGKPVLFRLPEGKSNENDLIPNASYAYSTDNTWNDFQTRLLRTISDKDDGPLYLATEGYLDGIDPVSSVVFFDFDPKFASDPSPPLNSE